MTTDKDNVVRGLTKLFSERLARNRGAQGREDYYGIEVVDLSNDLDAFDLVLTFKAGQEYCCLEWGCHICVSRPEDWNAIRNALSMYGLEELPKLTIRKLRCIVEAGAIWKPENRSRESKAYTYEVGPFIEGETNEVC